MDRPVEVCGHLFDGQAVEPEEIITRVVGLLAQRNVLFLTVWLGKKLEEKVLQLT